VSEDGGVCVTRQVYDHIQNKFELEMASLGVTPLKNVSMPIEIYRMVMPWEHAEQLSLPPELPRNRVAVLPFANMSPDPGDEYFADGMTEELIDRLAQVKSLKVIARTSVMSYKNRGKKVSEIAKELGDLDSCFEYMNKALEAHTLLASMLRYSPLFARARADPQYLELVERLRRQTGGRK